MRYYRGGLLPHLSRELFGIDDKHTRERLHEALKKRFGIKTTAALTYKEIKAYTRDIRTTFSVEWGILSPMPGDPSDIEQMDMKDFLKLTLEWNNNEQLKHGL